MTIPIFSVVIPLYNKEIYIERALISVCYQSIKDIEIIVVNDGSTDDGVAVVNEYISRHGEQRIKIINQENAGVSAARNVGINKAQADLVAFLDADDNWEPTYLETILRLKMNYPEAGAYATSFSVCNRKGIIRNNILRTVPPYPWEGLLPNYFKSLAVGEIPFNTNSICIPKYILKKMGGFPIGEITGEDQDLWCRIALNYRIAYSSSAKVTYNHDYMFDNAFTKGRTRKVIKEFKVINTICQAIDDSNVTEETKFWMNIVLRNLKLDMAKIYIINGDRSNAISTLLNSTLPSINKIYWLILSLIPLGIFKIGFKINQYIHKWYFRIYHGQHL